MVVNRNQIVMTPRNNVAAMVEAVGNGGLVPVPQDGTFSTGAPPVPGAQVGDAGIISMIGRGLARGAVGLSRFLNGTAVGQVGAALAGSALAGTVISPNEDGTATVEKKGPRKMNVGNVSALKNAAKRMNAAKKFADFVYTEAAKVAPPEPKSCPRKRKR